MADIFTSVVAFGTEPELLAMIHVLRKYSFERKEQYRANKDCWYFDTNIFDDVDTEAVCKLIDNGEIRCLLPGPYGATRDPNSEYNCLFTDLADAAPMAQFNIAIDGFDTGGKILSTALLREGKLYVDTEYRDLGKADKAESSGAQSGGKILANEGEENVLEGLTFVITGDLKKFKNRDSITIFIEERGGTVGSGVTKKTSFLINNAKRSKSAKNTKAKELGIPVITEKEFLDKFGLAYQPHKSPRGKMYEAGYYDPIKRVFQPPRKLKKEPLTLQIIFECTDQSRTVLQIDLDVEDFMSLSCTPEAILACEDLDELEKLLVNSVRSEEIKIAEFQSLLEKKWQTVKQELKNLDNVDRMILRRVDVRLETRLMSWDRIFHQELMPLAKKAAICKSAQKAENVAAFEKYLDEQTIWFPWSQVTGWPSDLCGFKERAELDWRSLTDDAELFAKLIVTEEIPELDHGEEMTIVNFKTREYYQSARYFPGW